MNMKKNIPQNPFADRLAAFAAKLYRRHISVALIQGETNLKGLVGFGCDNGILCVGSVPTVAGTVTVEVTPEKLVFTTPTPAEVTFGGRVRSFPAGKHEVAR